MAKSTIEWTDATWNPVVGCTPVSPGCLNCYAPTMARRLEATSEELICTIHAHPTMHESVHEAALASEGRVINS